jgi:hypothetical protein
MSYDLYCFLPSSDVPSIEEAQAIVESEEAGGKRDNAKSAETKRKIVRALTEHNPRLTSFQFDYAEIARSLKISEDQARSEWTHVELNPPEGDPAIQITVFGDHVSINIPYRYTGSQADVTFEQLSGYLRVIRGATGFFVYDPQTDRVLDPEKEEFGDHKSYEQTVREIPNIVAASKLKKREKPWWRFWSES